MHCAQNIKVFFFFAISCHASLFFCKIFPSYLLQWNTDGADVNEKYNKTLKYNLHCIGTIKNVLRSIISNLMKRIMHSFMAYFFSSTLYSFCNDFVKESIGISQFRSKEKKNICRMNFSYICVPYVYYCLSSTNSLFLKTVLKVQPQL